MSNERLVGTVSRGIRCPIIRQGDNLAAIVVDSVLAAARESGFDLRDRDVVAVTESVVARAQGNYASIDEIAADVRMKTGGGTVGVIFPILSRNRFAICLRGIAKGVKKVVLMFSYPSDEVGNELVSLDKLDAAGINPYSDVLDLAKYRTLFGINPHLFTGVDYVQYYSDLIRESGAEVEVVFANNCRTILSYTDAVITCDIHTRKRTKRILNAAGARVVLSLDDILNAPAVDAGVDGGTARAAGVDAAGFSAGSAGAAGVDGVAARGAGAGVDADCATVDAGVAGGTARAAGVDAAGSSAGSAGALGGYNPDFGLLGSNKATEDTVKLFPRNCRPLVLDIQKRFLDATGKHIEVMVYGDGAFKDPQGKIWELADPVVSPAYTDGLVGTPNELKLKYLADNDFAGLSGEALKEAISNSIRHKDGNLKGNMASQGTTPRQLTDLIGSLCDLTSGSGDKGTPVVLVQGYFDNYTND